MRSKVRSLCFAVLALSSFIAVTGYAQTDAPPKRGPSTADERKRFVAIAHKMEDAPLDPALRKERDWALRWLIAIPDINVNPCDSEVLGNFQESGYKYISEIRGQFSFSMAAFMIEHPDKAKDVAATNAAGAEGVVKAYRSILRDDPVAQSRILEALSALQRENKLANYVKEVTKNGCRAEGDNES